MLNLRKSLTALVGLLALVITLVALAPLVSRGQGNSGNAPPPWNVNILNTPLPVRGTVSVSNLGAEPLPVTGTVTVSNPSNAPLPVRDMDNPARQPIQANIIEIPPIPNPVFFTVPAGKRLVIEYVSADIEANNICGTAPRYVLRTTADGVTLDHFFNSEFTGTPSQTARAFGLSQQTRIYADANTRVTLDIRTEAFPSCGFVVNDGIHISGYLVDVP